MDATYTLSWRGLEVGTFAVRLSRGAGRYRVGYEARSTGFLGRLFPFTSLGWATGRDLDGRITPERYDGESRRRSGASRWYVAFDAGGNVSGTEVTGEDGDERDPVRPAQRTGVDPLTLALRALVQTTPGSRSAGTSFDGKRVSELSLSCADAMLGETPELACSVRSKVVAGASRRWRARSADGEEPEPGTLWLRQGVVAGAAWPVRAELMTGFGRVTARLDTPGPGPVN